MNNKENEMDKTMELYSDQEQQYVTPAKEEAQKVVDMDKAKIDPLLDSPITEVVTPLQTEIELYEALDKKLNNDEVKTRITISSSDTSNIKRIVLVDNDSYHFKDASSFDSLVLPQIYKKFTNRETDVITDQTDINDGRFMVSNDKEDILVILNIAPEVIENIQRYVNEEQGKEEQKQFVKQKTRTTSLNTMGFVNGFSIGMSIGTAIVLIVVALMYFGIIKLW